MNLRLVERLRCPLCAASLTPHELARGARGDCEAGVLVCDGCRAWYPVSGGVLELLPEGQSPPGARAGFFDSHRPQLEDLGLRAPAGAPPDPHFAAQEHQREHFDDLAVREDRFSYGALGRQPFQRAIRSLSFAEWAPRLREGMLAIDIGCADGLSTFDIARHGVETVGFDVSPEQLARAQARAEREGVANVSFMLADADAIPIADASVDCVLCFGSLHHVPDPQRTIAEAARVLADGGLYLGLENNATPLRPVFDMLMSVCPIWLEEAGAEAQISPGQLRAWSAGTGLEVTTRARVFLPPHLCNWLGYRAARRLLRITDASLSRVPLVRDWGGLIAIIGERAPREPGAGRRSPREARRG